MTTVTLGLINMGDLSYVMVKVKLIIKNLQEGVENEL